MNKRRTVSVRLDPDAARRLEKAAGITRQSQGAFLGKAGDDLAHTVLLDWAVGSYRRGEASFSQLAEETGLSVEEIMEAMGSRGQEAAMEMFLNSCRTIAEIQQNPEFLRLAEEAVEDVNSARAA